MSRTALRFGRFDLLAVAIAALVAFALTGCSGSNGSSTPTGVSTTLSTPGGSNSDDGTVDQGGGNPDDGAGAGSDDGTVDQGGGNPDDPPGDDHGSHGGDDGRGHT